MYQVHVFLVYSGTSVIATAPPVALGLRCPWWCYCVRHSSTRRIYSVLRCPFVPGLLELCRRCMKGFLTWGLGIMLPGRGGTSICPGENLL